MSENIQSEKLERQVRDSIEPKILKEIKRIDMAISKFCLRHAVKRDQCYLKLYPESVLFDYIIETVP